MRHSKQRRLPVMVAIAASALFLLGSAPPTLAHDEHGQQLLKGSYRLL
jgi:hypothetical protein